MENFQYISATANTKSRAALFGTSDNKYIAKQCTSLDLRMNNAVDDMNIFNCGFEFYIIRSDTVKQYEVWPDNLVQQ